MPGAIQEASDRLHSRIRAGTARHRNHYAVVELQNLGVDSVFQLGYQDRRYEEFALRMADNNSIRAALELAREKGVTIVLWERESIVDNGLIYLNPEKDDREILDFLLGKD